MLLPAGLLSSGYYGREISVLRLGVSVRTASQRRVISGRLLRAGAAAGPAPREANKQRDHRAVHRTGACLRLGSRGVKKVGNEFVHDGAETDLVTSQHREVDVEINGNDYAESARFSSLKIPPPSSKILLIK